MTEKASVMAIVHAGASKISVARKHGIASSTLPGWFKKQSFILEAVKSGRVEKKQNTKCMFPKIEAATCQWSNNVDESSSQVNSNQKRKA